MEIFIKADGKAHKINWLSSIPDKYKEDILKKIKQQALLKDISKINRPQRRRSQDDNNQHNIYNEISEEDHGNGLEEGRNKEDKYLSIKGLLGFQGANYTEGPSKDTSETFEVILNIKGNQSPKKKVGLTIIQV